MLLADNIMTVSLIVLLVIAILLLVLRPPLREHLTATAEIKAPPYAQGEKDRIITMVPGLLDEYRGLYTALAPNRYTDGEGDYSQWVKSNRDSRDGAIVKDLTDLVAAAYTSVYTPASAPLSPSSFDTLPDLTSALTPPTGYVVVNSEYGTGRVGDPLPVPTVDQVKPLRLRVLKTYFNATSAAAGSNASLRGPSQLFANRSDGKWDDIVTRIEWATPTIYSALGLPTETPRGQREGALKDKLQDVYDNLYAPATAPLTESDLETYVNAMSSLSQAAKNAIATAAKIFFLYQSSRPASPGAATGATGATGASGPPTPNAFTIAGESPYSATETSRISTLSPAATAAMKAAYLRASAAGATDDQVAIELARFIGTVYTNVYANATPPITQTQIEAYVNRTAWSGLTADDRAKLVELAVLYFGATRTPVATGATGATGGTGTTTTTTPTGTTAPRPRTWRTDGSGMTIPTQLSSISTMRESPYSEAETKRIAALSPRAKALVERGYANVTPPDGITKEQLVERFLATQVAKFYENYYATLQTPLTLELIGIYVDQTYPSSSDANKQAYKELLQRYFIQTGQVNRTDSAFTELDTNTDDRLSRDEFNQYMPGGQGGGGGGGTGGTGAAGGSAPITSEFEQHIQGYRTALVNYKLTGNTSFKTQADSFKAWIEQQIADMKSGVSENASYIQTFLQNYSSSDQDLRSLQAGLRTIRQTGPDVQAQYETEKEAQKTEPLDFTPFYSKVGLLAGIVGVVAGVSMLV